jgi:hypothetical protein
MSKEGEEGITGSLGGKDLHGFCSSFEFLVKPFNDVGGSRRDPFLFREIEEGKASINGFFQAPYCKRDRIYHLASLVVSLMHYSD